LKTTDNRRTPENPDLALIRRAQHGDERAFARLVKDYESIVYSFAYKLCHDKAKAEETWQDTFVNVFRKLKQFDGKSKFTTWLYSIVVNNCLMKHRRSKLEQATVHIDAPEGFHEDPVKDPEGHVVQTIASWKDTPIDSLMNKELRSRLDGAIKKLPVDYRAVFVLRDVEGQSAEEVSRILKLSVPAVKSRLRRARVFLREQLNEYMTT
jgi:RNA polymerase sigma-70 factor (ECF subfamily)